MHDVAPKGEKKTSQRGHVPCTLTTEQRVGTPNGRATHVTPTPLTRAAQHLSAITTLADNLAAELPHRATAKTMPGGDALAALAPVANLEAHAHQHGTAEHHAIVHGTPWPDYSHETGAPTPMQQLLGWTQPLRHLLGTETRHPTYRTETDLLRRHLEALSQNPQFPRLVADLRAIRYQLETLTHDGDRPTKSQVPCWDDQCPTHPKLVHTWGTDETRDGYQCPACKRTYDPDQYARAVWQTFSDKTSDRWVTVADAYALLPQPKRTTRSWVQRGWVRATRDHTHQKLIWWPDLWSLWLNPPRRGRPAHG